MKLEYQLVIKEHYFKVLKFIIQENVYVIVKIQILKSLQILLVLMLFLFVVILQILLQSKGNVNTFILNWMVIFYSFYQCIFMLQFFHVKFKTLKTKCDKKC